MSMSRSTPKGRLLPKGRKNHKDDSRPPPEAYHDAEHPPRTRRGLCNDDKGGSAHPATLLRGYKGCSGRSAEMLSGYKGPSAHPADIMTGYRRLRARPLDDLNDDKSPAARQADKNMSRRGQDTL